ncbi:MAG: RdgB/HAM1 family non-canonical purine NTP pyrophosphatase [Salibacteraceae bacterium]
MKLIFASGNAHKLTELKLKAPKGIQIQSMREIGFEDEIEEPGETLEENARIKAQFIFDQFGENCFAGDSGLEIEALNNRPGVISARYAGDGCTFDDNNNKVLHELKGVENRKAKFRTVIHLILDGTHYTFQGSIEGNIIDEKAGEEGFGYDPIFIPEGYDKTFAQMTINEKNKISHRAKAVDELIKFLAKQ